MDSNFVFSPSEYRRISPATGKVPVLLVEDNAGDVLLLRQTLTEHRVNSQIFVATNGEEAIRLLDEIDETLLPCPELIILDLNLPRKTGFDVLRRVRSSPQCDRKPVVILSSTDGANLRAEAARFGVACYIRKPWDLEGYMEIGRQLKAILSKPQE